MPVRFKGDSEYHENYHWIGSPKSASFTPTKQQAAPTAGLTSPQSSAAKGFQNEPAILRKKKPIPLTTTSTTKMFNEDIVVPDDYMLLGSQDKFSTNVPYKDYLSKNRQRVLGTTYVATPSRQVVVEEVPQRPLPKINFDTGGPKPVEDPQPEVVVTGVKKPIEMSKTRVIAKEQTSPYIPAKQKTIGFIAKEPKEPFTNDKPQAPTTLAPTAAPVPIPAAIPVTVPKSSSITPAAATVAVAASVASPTTAVTAAAAPAVSVPPPPVLSQDPTVDSAKRKLFQKQDPNVDSGYAMKYRAGIAPPRQSAKRRSEYTRNYDWKQPVQSTPILAADVIVHNNNPQLGPYKDKIKKKSEYQKEFKAWKYKPVMTEAEMAAKTASELKRHNRASSNLRRAHSELDVTPDRLPAAGSPSRISFDNQRLTQSLNPQKPFFPLRRTVSWTSEYKSNYMPFSLYQYQDGAWHGAAPPHIKQVNAVEIVPATVSSSWVAEVKELRDKAEEYRKRSLGTHFSRAHVAQLISENSQLWDVVSVSSDLSALDLEQSKVTTSAGESKRRAAGKPSRQRTQSAQPAASAYQKDPTQPITHAIDSNHARKRLAWSSDGTRTASPSDSIRSIRSSSTPSIADTEIPLGPAASAAPPARMSSSTSSASSGTAENGRVQNPDLDEKPVVKRHHLDVTTPNKHGLLLASPPHTRPQTTVVKRIPDTKKVVSPVKTIQKPQAFNTPVQVNIPASQPHAVVPVLLSPTYGKPTPDTHVLLNEELMQPVDEVLETRYVQSPLTKGNLNAIAEGAGLTYKVPLPQEASWPQIMKKPRDDDELSQLSTSMMSTISNSSSLASETLERAAKRQKEFWGKSERAK